MRFEKFTNRLQQALSDAQSLAIGKDNTAIEGVHILSALLEEPSNISLLQQAGANLRDLQVKLQQALDAGMHISADGENLRIRGDAAQVQQWAERLRPHKAALLHLLANPAPAPNTTDWRAVRDAYYSHHHACPVCIAASKGYGLRCGAGASLWATYSATPWPGYSRR